MSIKSVQSFVYLFNDRGPPRFLRFCRTLLCSVSIISIVSIVSIAPPSLSHRDPIVIANALPAAGGRHKTGHYTGCFVGNHTGCFVGRNANFPTDAYCNDWTSGLQSSGLLYFSLLDFWTSVFWTSVFWTSGLPSSGLLITSWTSKYLI